MNERINPAHGPGDCNVCDRLRAEGERDFWAEAQAAKVSTRLRLLVVPMHETTTPENCGGCRMADGEATASVWCLAFDKRLVWTGRHDEHGAVFCRLPECVAAEEAAQE